MLTSTLPRWEGDTEPRFVLDLARHLSEYFDVELLAPHAPGSARYEVLEGVPVTRFRYWLPRWQSVAYEGGISWRLRANPLRLVQVPFFMASMAWHVVRRLRGNPRIDLIHAHWLIPQGLVAVLVRGLAGRHVPVVTTSHGGDLFGLRSRFWRTLKKTVLGKSDSVTVVSNAMVHATREICSDVYPLVIPMGTDLREKFVPPVEPRSSGGKNLIFVGRLVEKKGLEHLLNAIPLVAERHPEITLKVIGDGPLRQALETLVDRRGLTNWVSFVGAVPHQQLGAYYRAADIAVFPFVEAVSGDQEGFGLVMVEAMGAECGLVASKLPAVKDVVQNEETGLLVIPASPVELASAIDRLVSDPQMLRALSKKARTYALSHFDWSVSVKGFRKVFDSLLHGPLAHRKAENRNE